MRHRISASARTFYVSLIILTLFLKDGRFVPFISLFVEFALDLWHQARTIAIDTARIKIHVMLLTFQETLPIFAITDFNELDRIVSILDDGFGSKSISLCRRSCRGFVTFQSSLEIFDGGADVERTVCVIYDAIDFALNHGIVVGEISFLRSKRKKNQSFYDRT